MSAGSVDIHALAAARVGQILRGKWRLDALLGVGGSACVYAATHRNGKRGAVKLLRPELATNDEAKRRFLREGYVANRIEHPGAVAVLDDDTAEDGSAFLVMELLEGQTLEDYSRGRSGGRVTPSDAALIADKLLDVLVAAHDKGIVHRDLKPENIFLTLHGDVKILDFGTARLNENSNAGRMTEVGHIMGTPSFMPPEQALGHNAQIDGRTDLWALGAILYYVLSAKLVHSAETLNKVLLSAMTQQAPPLASVAPDVPRELCEVVDRALLFQQDKRWPDARSMQRALRSVRQSLPTTSPFFPLGRATMGRGGPMTSNVALTQDTYESPSRKGLVPALVFAGIVALGSIGGVIFFITSAKSTRASAQPTPAAAEVPAAPTSVVAVAPPAPTPTPTIQTSAAPTTTALAPGTSKQTQLGSTPRTPTTPTAKPKTSTPAPTKTGGTIDIYSQY
jgi:eukaryotic-like serine/threonine-protein kinase